MNNGYSFLLSFFLLCSGTAYAQDGKPPQRSKYPSWLSKPPERPSWMPQPPKRAVRAVRNLSTREPVRVPGFPNVLTVNLPAFLSIEVYPCVSLGMEYERFITKSGMFSVNLAAYWYTAYVYGKQSGDTWTSNFRGYQAMPAFLYHPLGNTRRVDISVGPCLALGRHREENETRDAPGLSHTTVTNTPYAALLGQFNLKRHHMGSFVLGMHFSAGAVITGSRYDRGVIQLGVKVGKRF